MKNESENEDESAPSRVSHSMVLEDRDWSLVSGFWISCMDIDDKKNLPSWVQGSLDNNNNNNNNNNSYGITNIEEIHEIGKDEYNSTDPRHKRQTFAIRIGYNGCEYNGYQMQKGNNNINTVEGDIYNALGLSTNAAGRTDNNVSAISQIISFHSYENITPQDILKKLKDSDACKLKRLGAWDCYRVPRKFHALFSATWRRYLYLLPLKMNEVNNNIIYDIDVQFVNLLFSKLEGLPLSYNGFAYREWIDINKGDNGDICTLYKACAFLVDLDASSFDNIHHDNNNLKKPAMCVELIGTRFLRRMVRILVATACRESLLPLTIRDPDKLLNICKEGDRKKAHSSINGIGLAMAGVGYNIDDLKPKHGVSKKRKL